MRLKLYVEVEVKWKEVNRKELSTDDYTFVCTCQMPPKTSLQTFTYYYIERPQHMST